MVDSFRALCAELTDKLHQYAETFPEHDVAPLVQRARDLLDLDEPEGEDRSQISDGYHTFAELYEHRHALTLALMKAMPRHFWFSRRHHDGELCFGDGEWFIIGAELPDSGEITYHLPIRLWELAQLAGATELERGQPWDGHTTCDVVHRLKAWAACPALTQPEGEGPSEDDLTQLLFDSFRGQIEFICDAEEEAHLMIRSHVKFARAAIAADRARRTTPQPPADVEVAELVAELKVAAVTVKSEGEHHEDAAVLRAAELLQRQYPQSVAIPGEDYHENMGPVLWWQFPIEEPPYPGMPLDTDWPGYHTHFTPLVIPNEPHTRSLPFRALPVPTSEEASNAS